MSLEVRVPLRSVSLSIWVCVAAACAWIWRFGKHFQCRARSILSKNLPQWNLVSDESLPLLCCIMHASGPSHVKLGLLPKKKTCPKTCPKKRRIHLSAFHLNGTNTSTTCHPSISLCIDLPLFTSIYLICSSWSSWLILSKQHRGLPTAAAIAFSLPPGNGQFRGV